MKQLTTLLFIFISTLIFAQDHFKFPTYPGCQKQKTNEDLQKCFYDKLHNEMKFAFEEQDNFWTTNNNLDNTTLVFTVTKNGELANFSYTKESNPEAAKFFLKQVYRIKKHYEAKNKKFLPALENGKPVDFQIKYNLTYHQVK